jgi:hypothetical protein
MDEKNYGRVFVVMPACNEGKTLIKTFSNFPNVLKSNVIIADDFLIDDTFEVTNSLGIA